MKVQVIKWLISHDHAMRMIKKLNSKRQADQGFFFEYEEVGNLCKYAGAWARLRCSKSVNHDRAKGLQIYSDYTKAAEGGILTVFREKPEVRCWFTQQSVPESAAAEFADARRELAKWINEEPNRPVDKSAILSLITLYDLTLGGWRS